MDSLTIFGERTTDSPLRKREGMVAAVSAHSGRRVGTVVRHIGRHQLPLKENHFHVVLAAHQTRHHDQGVAVTQSYPRVIQLEA